MSLLLNLRLEVWKSKDLFLHAFNSTTRTKELWLVVKTTFMTAKSLSISDTFCFGHLHTWLKEITIANCWEENSLKYLLLNIYRTPLTKVLKSRPTLMINKVYKITNGVKTTMHWIWKISSKSKKTKFHLLCYHTRCSVSKRIAQQSNSRKEETNIFWNSMSTQM